MPNHFQISIVRQHLYKLYDSSISVVALQTAPSLLNYALSHLVECTDLVITQHDKNTRFLRYKTSEVTKAAAWDELIRVILIGLNSHLTNFNRSDFDDKNAEFRTTFAKHVGAVLLKICKATNVKLSESSLYLTYEVLSEMLTKHPSNKDLVRETGFASDLGRIISAMTDRHLAYLAYEIAFRICPPATSPVQRAAFINDVFDPRFFQDAASALQTSFGSLRAAEVVNAAKKILHDLAKDDQCRAQPFECILKLGSETCMPSSQAQGSNVKVTCWVGTYGIQAMVLVSPALMSAFVEDEEQDPGRLAISFDYVREINFGTQSAQLVCSDLPSLYEKKLELPLDSRKRFVVDLVFDTSADLDAFKRCLGSRKLDNLDPEERPRAEQVKATTERQRRRASESVQPVASFREAKQAVADRAHGHSMPAVVEPEATYRAKTVAKDANLHELSSDGAFASRNNSTEVKEKDLHAKAIDAVKARPEQSKHEPVSEKPDSDLSSAESSHNASKADEQTLPRTNVKQRKTDKAGYGKRKRMSKTSSKSDHEDEILAAPRDSDASDEKQRVKFAKEVKTIAGEPARKKSDSDLSSVDDASEEEEQTLPREEPKQHKTNTSRYGKRASVSKATAAGKKQSSDSKKADSGEETDYDEPPQGVSTKTSNAVRSKAAAKVNSKSKVNVDESKAPTKHAAKSRKEAKRINPPPKEPTRPARAPRKAKQAAEAKVRKSMVEEENDFFTRAVSTKKADRVDKPEKNPDAPAVSSREDEAESIEERQDAEAIEYQNDDTQYGSPIAHEPAHQEQPEVAPIINAHGKRSKDDDEAPRVDHGTERGTKRQKQVQTMSQQVDPLYKPDSSDQSNSRCRLYNAMSSPRAVFGKAEPRRVDALPAPQDVDLPFIRSSELRRLYGSHSSHQAELEQQADERPLDSAAAVSMTGVEQEQSSSFRISDTRANKDGAVEGKDKAEESFARNIQSAVSKAHSFNRNWIHGPRDRTRYNEPSQSPSPAQKRKEDKSVQFDAPAAARAKVPSALLPGKKRVSLPAHGVTTRDKPKSKAQTRTDKKSSSQTEQQQSAADTDESTLILIELSKALVMRNEERQEEEMDMVDQVVNKSRNKLNAMLNDRSTFYQSILKSTLSSLKRCDQSLESLHQLRTTLSSVAVAF